MGKDNNKISKLDVFVVGALTASAGIFYFMFGSKNARHNRKKVEEWTEKGKEEVMLKARQTKALTKEKYYDIVDSVMEKYSKLKEVGKDKTSMFKKELKDYWESIEEEARERMDDEEEMT